MCGTWKNGQSTTQFEVNSRAREPNWCGPRFLLANNYLIDLDFGANIWRYTLLQHVPNSYDNRCWYVHRATEQVIAPTQLPSEKIRSDIADAIKDKVPLLKAGDKVAISVRLNAAPPEANFQAKLVASISERLKEHGFQVAQSSNLWVVLEVGEKTEGPDIEYRQFGTNRRVLTVPDRSLTLGVKLVDSSGKPLWGFATKFRTHASSTIHLETGEEQKYAQKFLNSRWNNLNAWANSFAMPRAIHSFSGTDGLGSSRLVPDQRAIATTGLDKPDKPREWNVNPDPLPLPEKPFGNKPINLGMGNKATARFAHPTVGQVAVELEERGRERVNHIGRIDLRTGKLIGQFTVDDRTKLLDKWNHKLELWTLPELENVYSVDCKNPDDIWTFSHDRKYLVVRDDQRIVFYDLLTGKVAGETEDAPRKVNRFGGGAFSPDGKQFAATFDPAEGNTGLFTLWDVETGKLKDYFDVKNDRGYHQWCTPQHVFAAGQLVDLKLRSAVWSYRFSKPILGTADGRCWFADRGSKRRWHLLAAPTPSKDVFAAIDAAKEEGIVLKAGDAVGVVVRAETVDRSSVELEQQLDKDFTEKLKQAGLEVKFEEKVQLEVEIKERESGLKLTANSAASGGGKRTIMERVIDVKLAYVAGLDRTYWTHSTTIKIPFFDRSAGLQTDDPEKFLDRRLWDEFDAWLAAVKLPNELYEWTTGGGVGESTISIEGEKIKINEGVKSDFR